MARPSKPKDDIWDEMMGVSSEDTPAWTVKHELDQLRYMETQMPTWHFTFIESRPPSIEYIALLTMSLRMHSGRKGLREQIETRFAYYADPVKNAMAHKEIRKNVSTIAFLFDYDPQKFRPALLACPTFVELLLYIWTPRDPYGEELYACFDLANVENPYNSPCPFVALFRKVVEDEASRAALFHHIHLYRTKRGHKDLIWGVVRRIQLSVTVPEFNEVISYRKLFLAQDLLAITCALSTDSPWMKQTFIREPYWTLGWFSLALESNGFAALEKEGDKYNIIPSAVEPAIQLFRWCVEEDNVNTVRNFKTLVKGKFLQLLMLIDCGFGPQETLAMWSVFGQYIPHPGVVDTLLEVWENTARTGRPPDHIDLPEELRVFWEAVAYNYRVRVECRGEPLDLCDYLKYMGLWKHGCADSKQCSGCSTVIYCSEECQETDWRELHHAECSRACAQHSLRVANGTWYRHPSRFFHLVLVEWRYEEIVSNSSIYSWKFEQSLPSTPFSLVDTLPVLSFLDVKFEWDVKPVSYILQQSYRMSGQQPTNIEYVAQEAFFDPRWTIFVEAYAKEGRKNPKGVRLVMAHFALSKDWVITLLVKLGGQRGKRLVSGDGRLMIGLVYGGMDVEPEAPVEKAAVYLDAMEGNVYVSQDEGKSWKRADDIPAGKVTTVIEHPFDTRYAFALTDSTTHYRTEDRGRTWRPFKVPDPPARVGRPLSFHSDAAKYGHILIQTTRCDGRGWGAKCKDITYYTKEAFSDNAKELLSDTMRCQFAHGSKDFRHDAPLDLVYCVAFDTESPTGPHHLANSRLFSSTDFFNKDKKIEDLGIGREAKGVVALAIVSKFAVVALKDTTKGDGEMRLYVTLDSKNWAKAHFPHASSAKLRENAYTVVESTTHSLGVDVVMRDRSTIGTLFVSNSNGTYFVESLKDTNRNEMGFVDYERIYGVEGVGLANVVANPEDVEAGRAPKQLKTLVTYDDGRDWQSLRAPAYDANGDRTSCDVSDIDSCALHMHSVTNPHNFGRVFSSPAPGFVMGVGSVGKSLGAYDDGDTFLSTDAGVSWKMVAKGAHKYEFGDQGSILVLVDDEQLTNEVKYSLDLGKTWNTYNLGVTLRARGLVTMPDSTSQKFLLLGQVPRDTKKNQPTKVVIVYLDFTATRNKKCTESEFEKWYARPPGSRSCLMGHKQWYKRRKSDADCYVGEKFNDPVEHEENCECTKQDYECDYNFVRHGDKCEPAGPEPIPAGVCTGDPNKTYMGSSGFRKIPGNTCIGGVKLDEPMSKPCSKAKPAEGEVIHQRFLFDSPVLQHAYFKDSTTILVRLADHTIWQSSNEGYTWNKIDPGRDKKFLAFYHHKFSNERAYLITDSETVVYTTDTGRTWNSFQAPTPPNTFGAQTLRFTPADTDYVLWVGNKNCDKQGQNCHAEAQLSRDNGRRWAFVETHVRNCAFAKDRELDTDPTEIICESFTNKKGRQGMPSPSNPMELVVGSNYFKNKKRLFEQVVGFAKFSEFLIVANMIPEQHSLELQVSLDGTHFASGRFPPTMHPETHAYTILESTTKALFLHMTMSEPPTAPFWGNILKSNSNGTYFNSAIENVNRDERGYVDFEKVIGLDGIALVNIVADPDEATLSGTKKLQTRITHNDGSTWKPLTPPTTDSQGNRYACAEAKCALHIHGYTERRDPRATYSSPSIVGVLMAVGNVGETLAPYKDSDTFLSRDAGFTWEEVRKDAHMWEFGDSGSLIVMVNDEEPVDFLLFSTDEGLNWREYKFSDHKVRVMNIVNVPSDTSRRFLLLAQPAKGVGAIAIHVDFSSLVNRQCSLDLENPANDDFELWSPSEDRNEKCLFGRQTLYHRRLRDAQCYIGDLPKVDSKIQKNCACSKVDFECEFNYVKNDRDECVLVAGTQPLPDDDSCQNGEEYWYERTPYRLIPYSSCEDGNRLDRGPSHKCPGFKSKSAWFWLFMLLIPFAFTSLVGYYYYRRSGLAKGTIRLPGGDNRAPPRFSSDAGIMDTLASVPWYLVGLAGIAFEWVSSRLDSSSWRASNGYRNVPVDEDAQILRFEDEE